MIRKIIHIDEEKCNGCGICAEACHEGAIGIIDGKARLMRDDYCDGMGDCLPECPTGAISFEVREAAAYDEKAVQENKKLKKNVMKTAVGKVERNTGSCLRNWPVQIRLAPVMTSCYEGADLLVAADCTAYAYADFHRDFINGKTVLVGCPKLDDVDYSEKLTAILSSNTIKSLTVVRMEVPCCGGLEMAARKALLMSGKNIRYSVFTISTDGKIIE